jgi:hypothetical protein
MTMIVAGKMQLEDLTENVDCPICKQPAHHRYMEVVENGRLTAYAWVGCLHCRKRYGNPPPRPGKGLVCRLAEWIRRRLPRR